MTDDTLRHFWACAIEDAELNARIELDTLERMQREGFPVTGESFVAVWQRRDARIRKAEAQLAKLTRRATGDAA